uniref:Uncharacterized protein n=1 Tax=Rhizophora mucronata TaxID=61149 RepID=A0A2P2PDF3_RHIMU
MFFELQEILVFSFRLHVTLLKLRRVRWGIQKFLLTACVQD